MYHTTMSVTCVPCSISAVILGASGGKTFDVLSQNSEVLYAMAEAAATGSLYIDEETSTVLSIRSPDSYGIGSVRHLCAVKPRTSLSWAYYAIAGIAVGCAATVGYAIHWTRYESFC